MGSDDDDDDDGWADYVAPTPLEPPLPQDKGTEDEFRASEAEGVPNYGFVAIAIGRWASRPGYPRHRPEWAIAECIKISEAARIATRRVLGAAYPSPKVNLEDGLVLDRIADLLIRPTKAKRAGFSKKVTSRAAIRYVLGVTDTNDDTAEVKKFQRLWRRAKGQRLTEAAGRLLSEAIAAGARTGVE